MEIFCYFLLNHFLIFGKSDQNLCFVVFNISGVSKLVLAGQQQMSALHQTITCNSRLLVAGIEPHGNKVLHPAVFTVETLEAGSGEVLVFVEDPEGHKEEASYK